MAINLSLTLVLEWFNHIQDRQEYVEDNSYPGCPSKSKTENKIKKILFWLDMITA